MRGYRGVKYTLFVCCYVFWVVSSLLIAVGIYAKVAKEKDVVDTLTLDPALLLIVVGTVTFLITFLGCWGALRNATCLLKTSCGILYLVIFWDLCVRAVVRYREDRDLENAIDFVQKKFQCCGVESYKDWSKNVYFECSDENPSLEACGVPFSCCKPETNQTVLNTMCGYGVQTLDDSSAQDEVFTVGCLQRTVLWAQTHLLLVAGLSAGLLLLEVRGRGQGTGQICGEDTAVF
uniref:Tetraspanin n=1 Tax=Periophthalmus magnuspinnatus TaxID=409849 RepID=A0A3B4A651_9GOBI